MKLQNVLSRPRSIREAAALIFALVALLPFLLFFLLLWRYELVMDTEVQVALLLALLIALLGFAVFQRMVERISKLAEGVQSAKADALRENQLTTVPGIGPVFEIGQLAQAFARMLEDLRASTERLEDVVFKLTTLNEMAELAARIPKIQELLGLVLERTMRSVRATIGSIMLLDEERGTLKVMAARGLSDDVIEGGEVRVGEGIAGRVAQLGQPVLVDDIEIDSRFSRINDPKYGGGSFISIPIRVGDRIIGVINLAKKEFGAASSPGPQPFTPTDLQFLNALMTYIAYAVDNARLLEEARQATLRLQEVVEDQQLRLTLAQRERLQAEKLAAMGSLLAGVAHELNNPLMVILGQTALLREIPSNEALARRAEKITKATDRCVRIVRNFLALARERPTERQRVLLNQVVREAVELLDYPFRVDNVEVTLNLASGLPVLWADPNQLQQVVVNLITNAHQAMRGVPPPRRMTLTTRSEAGQKGVILEVADTGPGIPLEIQTRIFDPFFTTKPPGQGAGLGLSLCQGIIDGHGGSIRVESQPGRGAVFQIELPVEAPPVAVSEPRTVETVPRLQGMTVLVVDDEADVAEVLADLLAVDGHQVDTATNGASALDMLKKRTYDLILSDLKMPELDGPGFYREIELRHPVLSRRFIFLTGDTLSLETKQFLDQTGAPSLGKPFDLEEFRKILQRVLQTGA